jgi:hypothetical protein
VHTVQRRLLGGPVLCHRGRCIGLLLFASFECRFSSVARSIVGFWGHGRIDTWKGAV